MFIATLPTYGVYGYGRLVQVAETFNISRFWTVNCMKMRFRFDRNVCRSYFNDFSQKVQIKKLKKLK